MGGKRGPRHAYRALSPRFCMCKNWRCTRVTRSQLSHTDPDGDGRQKYHPLPPKPHPSLSPCSSSRLYTLAFRLPSAWGGLLFAPSPGRHLPPYLNARIARVCRSENDRAITRSRLSRLSGRFDGRFKIKKKDAAAERIYKQDEKWPLEYFNTHGRRSR